MSEEDKAARRAVKEYLEALEANKPKRGRKRTAGSIEKRLVALDAEMADASPLKKLDLTQERLDLEVELEQMATKVDMDALEAGFVKHAATYSASKDLSYQTWREVGVASAVLQKAGISRGS